MSLCLDQLYGMQSVNQSSLAQTAQTFFQNPYNLNIEENGENSNSLYELAILGETEGKGGHFSILPEKNYCPERMVKKTKEQRYQSGKGNI